jgi:hypothetical protein
MTQQVKVGFDLDGVLVPDFILSEDPEQKNLNIATMLAARKLIAPICDPIERLSNRGRIPYIITSRPARDTEATRAWVAEWFPEFPLSNLFIRTDDTIATTMEAAAFKAKVILEQGIHYYVESDPSQISLINEILRGCGPTRQCTVLYANALFANAVVNKIDSFE